MGTGEPSKARPTAEGCPQGSEAHQSESDHSSVPILLSINLIALPLWEVVSPACPIRETLSRSESRLERSGLWQAIQENVKYPDRRMPLPLMRAFQFVPQFGKDGHG